jgi:Ner family transcriptional regulator
MANKTQEKDWHTADIKAALAKKGLTFRKLSTDAGLKKDTLRNVLDRKWPKGEMIVANAIGVSPSIIWPSRY